MFTPQELMRMANREYMLGDSSTDELVAFIEDQIAEPFSSGDTNYFKKLRKKMSSDNDLDEICNRFFTQIQDIFPKLSIDVSDYDQHLAEPFMVVYKFFVKNIAKLMFIFIREYLFTNRNRRALVDEYSNLKIPNYPKEQYGKKEYYILITKLNGIVESIFDGNIRLPEFIDYVEKAKDDAPIYLEQLRKLIEDGIVIDNGVVHQLYKRYRRSDRFRGDMNKLEMDITTNLILPYMEQEGIMAVRLPPTEELPSLDDEDEEEED